MFNEHISPISTRSEQVRKPEKKLSPFETYIALVKGYCVILVLILPKAFVQGGYTLTAILEIVFGVTSTLAAGMLVKAGLHEKEFSYSQLTRKVLGEKAKLMIDIMIGLAQYSFTVSHISFIIQSLQTTVRQF